MKKFLIIAGLAAWQLQFASPAAADSLPAGRAEAVLWEGASALYQFAADPHSPFRAEVASDYHNVILEFERQLTLLKQSGKGGDAESFVEIETRWRKFKAVGADVIQSGLEGACCTSFQLARVRETAEEVEEALGEARGELALVD